MRRLPHVSLILGIAVFMAADGVNKAESSSRRASNSRRTDRSIRMVLDAAQWVSVRDGFVLHVYSQKEFTRFTARRAAYQKRRQEFLDKQKSLDEKREVLRQQLPSGKSYLDDYTARKFLNDDANKDGVLDAEEQKLLELEGLGAFDGDSDGKITRLELMRYVFITNRRDRRRSFEALPKNPKDLPENVDKLLRELDPLITKTEALTQEYKDVRFQWKKGIHYKVIEVGKDFLRIRHEKEERIIPFASIREIRRTLDD